MNWKNLTKMQEQEQQDKELYFAQQPEYNEWQQSRPGLILKDSSLSVDERVRLYEAASAPDSKFNRLDEELTKRWVAQADLTSVNIYEFIG